MRYLGPAACLLQADHVKNLTRTRLLFTHSKKTHAHAPTKRRIMGCKKTPQRSRSARNSSSKVEKNRKLRSVGTGKPVSSKLWSFSPYPREGELFDQDKSTNTHSSAWRRVFRPWETLRELVGWIERQSEQLLSFHVLPTFGDLFKFVLPAATLTSELLHENLSKFLQSTKLTSISN